MLGESFLLRFNIFGFRKRKIEEIKKDIQGKFKTFLQIPDADLEIWRDWVNEKKRDKYDLEKLLHHNARENIKIIALYLLLIPVKEFNFFYWNNKNSLNGLPVLFNLTFWGKTPKKLRNFARDLICYFYNLGWEYPKNSGCCYNFSYNDCILSLLDFLPADSDEAKILFTCFNYGEYQKKGDKHWRGIYNRKGLDERWKVLFDEHIQKILFEKFEKIKERCVDEYEFQDERHRLFYYYIEVVSDVLYCELKILAEKQIRFLMHIWSLRKTQKNFISEHYWYKIINSLEKQGLKKILDDFIYFIVIEQSVFYVWSDTIKRAEHLLAICQNKEAGQKIQKEIDFYYKREEEKRKRREESEKKDLLNKKEEEMSFARLK